MIVLQCNDTYFKWLKLFLKSYVAQRNKFAVFISIFNGTAEMKADCEAICSNATVELDVTNQYGLPLADYTVRECMTSRKVYVLEDVIDRFNPNWVFMFDVDQICRKNLTGYIDQLNKKNVHMAVSKNPHLGINDLKRVYSASANYFSNSAFHVVSQWRFNVSSPSVVDVDYFKFGWDQRCLYDMIEQYKGEITIENLDRSLFIDEAFRNDSYFWTWGTPVQSMKDLVYDFFKAHCNGDPLTMDDAERYMQLFFSHHHYRAAFPFAHQLVMNDPRHYEAMYVLGVTYAKELKNNSLAKQIFDVLISVNYRVADCENQLALIL